MAVTNGNNQEGAARPHPDRAFRLGDIVVHPARNLISRAGGEVRVEAKVMDVLVALARQAGETLSREELSRLCWPGTLATDDVINRTISKLRKALGDDPREPRILQTIPKRGYRLTVRAAPMEHPMRKRRLTGRSVAGVMILAVLALGLLLWMLGPPPEGVGERVTETRGAPDARPLSNLSGYEGGPDISPDGRLIVFTNWAYEGPNAMNNNLFVKDIASDGPILALTSESEEQGGRFSPDGGRIAFIRWNADSCGIHVLRLPGGPEETLADCLARGSAGLDWIDDETLLVSDRLSADGPLRLMSLSLEDGARRIITDPPGQFVGDGMAAVSPDGAEAAFIRRRLDRDGDIFVVELANGAERRLTGEGGELSGLTWGPGGENIIYASSRSGVSALWRVASRAPGDPDYVPFVGINAAEPVYSDALGMLVYTVWNSEINVWRRPYGDTPGEPGRLITSAAWDWAPSPSPDGARLAYLTNRNGATELRVTGPDSGEPIIAAAFDRPFNSNLAWTPDGQKLVYSAPGRGQDIYVFDLATRQASVLIDDATDEVWPVISPDGEWVYFGSTRLGRWEIWRAPITGGTAQQITEEGGFRPGGFAPDGRLIFVRRGENGLRAVSPGGGGEQQYLPAAHPPYPAAWTVGDAGVYAIEGDFNTGFSLTLHPFDGGEPRILIAGLEEVFFESSIHVDEAKDTALIPRIDKSGSDLWALRMP